jgi:signal transduction histidine kinase
VDVSDSGPGISPEHLERIFEPFFTTKPASEGTGLGLTICRQIASGLGGTVTVDSTPGRGATFRVTLPVAEPTHGSEETEERFVPSRPPVRRLKHRRPS